MKLITKSVVLIGVVALFLFTSCSEEDVLEELTGGCVPITAIENYSAALERYNNNPTVENCESFKSASIAYLRALDDCPFINDEELKEALRAASESNCEEQD